MSFRQILKLTNYDFSVLIIQVSVCTNTICEAKAHTPDCSKVLLLDCFFLLLALYDASERGYP